ncbi:hypothetical protein OGATHE_005073 [Ogataea polymorpha]|uniref:Secreted protein n=1 Tax=Ogataea polymorpha TaxID=460523 RepID=A0A9P8T0L8_9ASCO|nr:hypothetical protein OGATHE_005073 [Ogataea polymorpha]
MLFLVYFAAAAGCCSLPEANKSLLPCCNCISFSNSFNWVSPKIPKAKGTPRSKVEEVRIHNPLPHFLAKVDAVEETDSKVEAMYCLCSGKIMSLSASILCNKVSFSSNSSSDSNSDSVSTSSAPDLNTFSSSFC